MFGMSLGNLYVRIGADTSGLKSAEGEVAASSRIMSASLGAVNVVAGTLAATFRILRTAIISTGIGALVVSAGALTNGIIKIIETTETWGDAFREIGKRAELLFDALIWGFRAVGDSLESIWATAMATILRYTGQAASSITSIFGITLESIEAMIVRLDQRAKNLADAAQSSAIIAIEQFKRAFASIGGEDAGGGRAFGTGAEDREQEMLNRRLERLRESLLTEEEYERNSYANRLLEIEEFYERGMLIKADYDEMLERAHQEHSDRMTEITRRQIEEEERLRSMTLRAVSSTLGSISSAIESFGEKNLAAAKAFSIAQALINTYEGITKALTLPFPLNWAQAAAVAASGFAQVASIVSTNKGSRGGSGGVSSGAGAGASAEQTRTVNISLQGVSPNRMYSGDQVRELAEALVEYQSDGGQVVLVNV